MSALIGIHTDTALWLHNKLRNDDNLWSSGSIASQFTITILQDIYDCFIQLESKAKIKILLSMLEIPLRNMENLKDSISRIIAIAEEDLDEWVRVAANIVRDYPQQFEIDQRLGKVTTHFQQTVHEIVSDIERVQQPSNSNLIPGECLYLNPTALSKIISNPPPPNKHFTLRRKPKSAALRAKITQKATDAANQRRALHPSGPTSKASLKRTNSLPSGKLLPVQHSKSGLSKALPKKTKLLEIADQPLGVREQKKRKRIQAMEASLEEAKQKKKNAESAKQAPEKDADEDKDKDFSTDTANENTENEEDSDANTSRNQESDATDLDVITPPVFNEEETGNASGSDQRKSGTPSYAILPGTTGNETTVSKGDDGSNARNRRTSSSSSQSQPQTPNEPQHQQQAATGGLTHNINQMINVNPNASFTTQSFQRELQLRVQQEHELRVQHEQKKHKNKQQQQQQPQPQQPVPQQQQQPQQQQTSVQQQQSQQQQSYNQQLLQQQQQQQQSQLRQQQQQMQLQQQQQPQPFPAASNMPVPAHQIPAAMQPTVPGMALQSSTQLTTPQLGTAQQKKGLSLTRDQMLAAQEMFRSANSVTRAEKALILGFMAGARDNPFPQQGPVITIKLSEEVIPQGAQHMLVEMLFEMNYDSGHWRRLKRTRVMQQGAS